MELYFKDLISKEAKLEKLVDDLALAAEGADTFAAEAAARLPHHRREELQARVRQFQARCHQIRSYALDRAAAADKTLRKYPYSSIGFAFSLGLLAGALARRSSS